MLIFDEDAGASFDQTKAELVAALRKEKEGYFVMLMQDEWRFSWHTMTDVDGCEEFLRAVISSARQELADLANLVGVKD